MQKNNHLESLGTTELKCLCENRLICVNSVLVSFLSGSVFQVLSLTWFTNYPQLLEWTGLSVWFADHPLLFVTRSVSLLTHSLLMFKFIHKLVHKHGPLHFWVLHHWFLKIYCAALVMKTCKTYNL